jgi:bifunctional non-homologous end joining protein LigD
MQTEDHPIEYGTFEGVIPEGYGAGIVMLWDQGTWEPEGDDITAAIRKGDLKFRLNGYKMKGSWVLVRTGGRFGSSDNRSWLLIKHRDDWAGPVDITTFAPLSVKSGGDFDDILAADTPDVWLSNRPAKGGTAGAMLREIVERVAKLKAGRTARAAAPAATEAQDSTAAPRRTSKSAAAKPRAAKAPATRRTRTPRAPAKTAASRTRR